VDAEVLEVRAGGKEDEVMTNALVDQLRRVGSTDENGEPSVELLAAGEIERLTRDMAALQSQWDDMQQGFVEVFGEPVQDAIELLGTVERIRSGNEPRVCIVDGFACDATQRCEGCGFRHGSDEVCII
jgi:hypothetical protein